MKRTFAVFDIDWTLHHSSLGVEFLFELSRQGYLENELSEDIYRTWRKTADRRAFFREHFAEIYDTGLRGVPKTNLEHAGRSLAERVELTIFDELRHEIKQSQQADKLMIAISQSPSIAVQPLAELLGFDVCISLEFEYDMYENYLQPRYRSDEEKDKGILLKLLVEKHNLCFADSRAYGDSLDDLPMLELVERPVAVNPSSELRLVAEERGWRIITASVQ